MLLSSGVVWRYREWETFAPSARAATRRSNGSSGRGSTTRSPGSSPSERRWWRGDGNPLTTGVRFDPRGLTPGACEGRPPRRAAARAPDGIATILATGGFQGDRRARPPLRHVRATPAQGQPVEHRRRSASGSGSRLCALRGDGRVLRQEPGRGPEDRRGGLRAAGAGLRAARDRRKRAGERFEARHWADVDVVQWTARQPGARAWYVVADAALDEPVRERTVREVIDEAREAGAPVERIDGATRVQVRAAITTTLGGIRVDERARAPTACGPPARTSAASRPAAGRAPWPRRSFSAGPPPRTPSGTRVTSARSGGLEVGARAGVVREGRRAELETVKRTPSSSSISDPGAGGWPSRSCSS